MQSTQQTLRRTIFAVTAFVLTFTQAVGQTQPPAAPPGSAPAAAAAGSIRGRVLNAGTGNYLANAEVRIAGTDITTLTTRDGHYSFSGVPAGETRIVASYPGLDNLEQTVTVPSGGTAVSDFSLTTAGYESVVKLSEFIVGGTREGNAQAVVDQRQATNLKTVIASDAFGSVAEDNVGEFLKFMSGLTIDYNENDARQVRVRGLSAKYASVLVDGNPVASADFGIGTGRGFQFEQVSLSTIDTIELNKTPLADMPADSLAGTVNVKSKSALNQKGRRIRYSASLTANEYNTQLDKTIGWDNQEHFKVLPNASLEFADTFMDEKFGIVAAVNHTGTYVEQKIIAGLGRSWDSDPNNNATEIPRITQVNWQDGLKPTFRDAVLVNLDYKLTPEVVLSLRTSYNFYDAPFHNRNWTLNASAATNSNVSVTGFTTTAASATDSNNNAVIAGTNFRKYGATFSINPAVNWKINDRMTLDTSASYSRSYQWYDSNAEGFFNIVSLRMRGLSWGYSSDAGDPNLKVRQLRTTNSNQGSWFDLSQYNDSTTAQIAERDAKDQFYTARADFTVSLPKLTIPTTIKAGADFRMLVKDIDTWTRTWSMNVNPATGGLDMRNYADPYKPDPGKGQIFTDINGNVAQMPSVDKWRLYDLFRTYNTDPYTVSTAAQQPFFLTAAQAAANLRNKLQNMWDFKETIQSAYLMAQMRPTTKFHGVVGVRFESTDSRGRAFDDIGAVRAAALSGTTDTNNFNYIQTRFGKRTWKKQSFDDLFPSAQARYTVADNLILRGGYFRSVLRPDVQNLARGLSIDDTLTLVQTANPNLQPEYANNFDARLEYYFKGVGYVSGGVFYKSIQDIQATNDVLLTRENMPQDVIELGFSPDDLINNSAQLRTVVNSGNTSVQGFEIDFMNQLSFLPGAFKNLGVFANYTYTDLKDRNLFAGGSGAPKQSANVGFSYRGGGFNGQLKFNWVDDRLLTAPGSNGVSTWERDRLQVDVNLDYQFNRRLTVFLNIANLTNSPSYRYQERQDIITRHGEFGAKYVLGVKGTF